MTDKLNIEGLYCDAIDIKPESMDWQRQGLTDYDGGPYWESWEANECEECGFDVVLQSGHGDEKHSDCEGYLGVNEDGDDIVNYCDGYVPLAEGPMMNYWYPFPSQDIDPIETAKAIADLPLCVVRVGDQYGLALTGGGMDLSWEICEAFIRAGYYPPVHFADLPLMVGRGQSETDQAIVRACMESCRIMQRWMEVRREGLRLAYKMEALPL